MVPILHRWACELIDLASVAEPAKATVLGKTRLAWRATEPKPTS